MHALRIKWPPCFMRIEYQPGTHSVRRHFLFAATRMARFNNMKQQWRRRLAALLCLSSICGVAPAGLEDRRFEQARLGLAEQVFAILIRERQCAGMDECRRMQLAFLSPGKGGIAVQVWGISSGHVLQAIAAACGTVFYENPQISLLSIDIYAMRKQEALNQPFWEPVKAQQEIVYRRKR